MPRFYSELQQASLENLGADPTPATAGRIYRNTADGGIKMDTGAAILSVVTETQTQTLTNKTLTSPTLNTPTVDVLNNNGQASTPANPSAGFYKTYVKDDTIPYLLKPSGTESRIIDASIVTAKGDLIAATANNAVARVAIGSDGTFLKADSAQSTGVAWGSPSAVVPYRSVTTTDTATTADSTLVLSGASFTQTLFTAVGNTGQVLTIIHDGTSLSQVYTLATTGGQTIGGVASGSYALYTNGEMLRIQSNGTNWKIIGRHTNTAPAAYTPTFTGFGTASGVSFQWCRTDGVWIRIWGTFTSGTTTAVTGRISLPTGAALATSYLNGAQVDRLGNYTNSDATGTALPTNSRGPWPLLYESGQTGTVSIGRDVDTDFTLYQLGLANANISSGNKVTVDSLMVPISGFQP